MDFVLKLQSSHFSSCFIHFPLNLNCYEGDIKSNWDDLGIFQNTDKANPSWIGGLGGEVGTQ